MENRANIEEEKSSSITWKALIIGSILSFLISVGVPYAYMIIKGSSIAEDFTTPVAIFCLFILAGILLIFSRKKKSFGLASSELLTIFIMMTVVASLCIMFSLYFLPHLVAPYYFATPENNWVGLIQPHIKPFLVPQGAEVIRTFFEGIPKGEHIPYIAWLKPLAIWFPFILVLNFVMVCIMVILRKQWIERERLIFPLAQLPLEMTKKRFFKNRLMWLGFALPFIIGTIKAFHHYFHFIPDINLVNYIPIFRYTDNLIFRLSFPMIGFSYLVNLDVAFSLWFFYLLQTVIKGFCAITGVGPTETLDLYSMGGGGPIFSHIGMGAILVLVLFGLWVGRTHLREVFRKAFRNDKRIDDTEEIVSYKVAVWGLILGILFMSFWLNKAGLSLGISFLFLLVAFIIFIGITRVVAEGGLAETRAPLIAPTAITSGLGTSAIGSSGLVTLGFTHIWTADIRTFVMVAVANGLKLVEKIKRKRILFWAIMLSVTIGLLGSIWMILRLCYTYGGMNTEDWCVVKGPQHTFTYVLNMLKHPQGPQWPGWILTGVGAGLMFLLMFMRQRFLWWPLHPLGLPFSGIMLTQQVWFSIFIAWLIKSAILRYGGPKIYKQSKTFFMGLILGQFVCSGVWIIIDYFTKTSGNSLFWI